MNKLNSLTSRYEESPVELIKWELSDEKKEEILKQIENPIVSQLLIDRFTSPNTEKSIQIKDQIHQNIPISSFPNRHINIDQKTRDLTLNQSQKEKVEDRLLRKQEEKKEKIENLRKAREDILNRDLQEVPTISPYSQIISKEDNKKKIRK